MVTWVFYSGSHKDAVKVFAGLYSLETQAFPNSGCCQSSFPHMCRTEDPSCMLSVVWRLLSGFCHGTSPRWHAFRSGPGRVTSPHHCYSLLVRNKSWVLPKGRIIQNVNIRQQRLWDITLASAIELKDKKKIIKENGSLPRSIMRKKYLNSENKI